MNNPKVLVSVTCYNNEDEVIKFANQLAKLNYNNKALVVSINACDNIPELEHRLREIKMPITICNPMKNLGYLHGCMFGELEYLKNDEYDWLMISNTDIELSEDLFDKLHLGEMDEDIWEIGVDVVLKETDVHQNPFMLKRPSKLKMLILQIVYSNTFFFVLYNKLARIIKRKKTNYEKPKSIFLYSVHGSIFLIKKECAKAIHREKDYMFMYDEELFVSEIIRENNKKVFLNVQAKAIHNENQVTGKIDYNKKRKWFRESNNFILKRFY